MLNRIIGLELVATLAFGLIYISDKDGKDQTKKYNPPVYKVRAQKMDEKSRYYYSPAYDATSVTSETTRKYAPNSYFAADLMDTPYNICGINITSVDGTKLDIDLTTGGGSVTVEALTLEHCLKLKDKQGDEQKDKQAAYLFIMQPSQKPVVGQIIDADVFHTNIIDSVIKIKVKFDSQNQDFLAGFVDPSKMRRLTWQDIGKTFQYCSYPQPLPDQFCNNATLLGFDLLGRAILDVTSVPGESSAFVRGQNGELVCAISEDQNNTDLHSKTLCNGLGSSH